MDNKINTQNKAFEDMINKYNSKDLDVSNIDFSDIRHIVSDNFITRGSMFKNSSFNDTKTTNESEKNYK